MKKLTTFFTIGLLALLTSCGGTKQSATADQVSRENVHNTRESTSNRNSREAVDRNETKSAVVNRNNDSYYSDNWKQMYSALDMTPDQIKRFESQWRRSVDTWKAENRNEEMNRYVRVEQQDRILKGILDDSQFDNYQQWARENAGRN